MHELGGVRVVDVRLQLSLERETERARKKQVERETQGTRTDVFSFSTCAVHLDHIMSDHYSLIAKAVHYIVE